MKILLPIDGSEYTDVVLQEAVKLDKELTTEPEFIAFTVVLGIPDFAASFFPPPDLDEYYREEAEKVLAPVREFKSGFGPHQWKLWTSYAHGHPAEEIAAFAKEQKVDLIIMGTHGFSAVMGVVMGSVTTGVLARCKVPTLLVHK